MTQQEKDNLINEVIKEFDFERVDRVMRMLNWEWAAWGDKKFIPGIYGLISEAVRLMKEVLENDDGNFRSISCGGFRSTFDGEYLTLEFIVEDYEAIAEGGEK